jgi:hypothetical protein
LIRVYFCSSCLYRLYITWMGFCNIVRYPGPFFFANINLSIQQKPRLSVNGTNCDFYYLAESNLHMKKEFELVIHSSLLLFFGGVLMLWSPNIYILLLARLIMGLGSGFVFTCVPIYIAETSSPTALYFG